MLATTIFALLLGGGQVQQQTYETGSRWELLPGQQIYASSSEESAIILNRWAAADPAMRVAPNSQLQSHIIRGVELLYGESAKSLIEGSWITFTLQSASAQRISIAGLPVEDEPAALKGVIESMCLRSGKHPLFGHKGQSLWIPHFFNGRPYALIGERCYAYGIDGERAFGAIGAFGLTELALAREAEDSGDAATLSLLRRGGRLVGTTGKELGVVIEGTATASRVSFLGGKLKGKKLWFSKNMCRTLPR